MIDTLIGKFPIPDFILRKGIQHLLSGKKKEVNDLFPEGQQGDENLKQFASTLKDMPIAIMTDKANEQHYEVPSRFYELVLGKHLKYSCGSWEKAKNLDESEVEMLDRYILNADIQDGQSILDLGCGWGSFTLYAARKFPNSNFTSVSNSSTQQTFIKAKAKELGLKNIQVITENVANLKMEKALFDRIVSVEMLEHVKNYKELFTNISTWLKDNGKFFVHIFTHKSGAYHFEVKDETDWMSKYFFSGGMMPADNLFYLFQDDLKVDKHWKVSGENYQKTSRAWLENMDRNKSEVLDLFAQTYGKGQAMKWFRYWRVFFMACEELWGYDKGQEWIVSHYLFSKKG